MMGAGPILGPKLVDAVAGEVNREVAAMESEGLVVFGPPFMSNPRVTGGDPDLRTVEIEVDIEPRALDEPPWSVVPGREAEVEARIKAAAERAMGLG